MNKQRMPIRLMYDMANMICFTIRPAPAPHALCDLRWAPDRPFLRLVVVRVARRPCERELDGAEAVVQPKLRASDRLQRRAATCRLLSSFHFYIYFSSLRFAVFVYGFRYIFLIAYFTNF